MAMTFSGCFTSPNVIGRSEIPDRLTCLRAVVQRSRHEEAEAVFDTRVNVFPGYAAAPSRRAIAMNPPIWPRA